MTLALLLIGWTLALLASLALLRASARAQAQAEIIRRQADQLAADEAKRRQVREAFRQRWSEHRARVAAARTPKDVA